MLLYFNKNGQLLERLTYGIEPRVGATVFQIFAYFEGVDLENYGAALIRFKRPDINGSEYPDLFMTNARINYNSNIEQSNYFKTTNNPYRGYVFDFEKVQDAEGIITMLDTPGMWEASITLVNTAGGNNVTGLVRFNVGGAVSSADDEETELDYSVITNNIAGAVSSKVDKGDSLYLRFHSDLQSAATLGTLLEASFIKDSFVYDAATNAIYRIVDVTTHDDDPLIEPGYEKAAYVLVFDFSDPNFESISVTDMFFVLGNPTFNTVGGLIDQARSQPGSNGTCVTFAKGANAIYMLSVYANGNNNYSISKIKFPFPATNSSQTKGYSLVGDYDDIKNVLLFSEGAPWNSQEFITEDKVEGANIVNGEIYPVSGGKVYAALLLKVDKNQTIAGIDLQDNITDEELINALFVVENVTIVKN